MLYSETCTSSFPLHGWLQLVAVSALPSRVRGFRRKKMEDDGRAEDSNTHFWKTKLQTGENQSDPKSNTTKKFTWTSSIWLPQQSIALKKYQSRETLAFQREEMCSHRIAWER